jgi:hypothetical protein
MQFDLPAGAREEPIRGESVSPGCCLVRGWALDAAAPLPSVLPIVDKGLGLLSQAAILPLMSAIRFHRAPDRLAAMILATAVRSGILLTLGIRCVGRG